MTNASVMFSNRKTNWNMCCLYQKDKSREEVKSPPSHYAPEKDGYTMLARTSPSSVNSMKCHFSWILHKFLRHEDNKTELYQFLADRVAQMSAGNTVNVTKGSAVLSTQEADLEGLQKCTHEEADSRIFVHASHSWSSPNFWSIGSTLTAMTRMSVSLALIVMLLLPCTVDWGWQKSGDNWQVFWTANASIAKSSEQLDQMWLQSWMPR